MFTSLKILFLTLALALTGAPALADSCDEARARYDKINKPLMEKLSRSLSNIFITEPDASKKASCERERVNLEVEQDILRRKLDIEQSCGKVHWPTCDAGCAAQGVREQEKKVAQICPPQDTEANKKVDLSPQIAEKPAAAPEATPPQSKFDDACDLLTFTNEIQKDDPNIALCNKSKTECGYARIKIENEQKKPNPGLTCPKR